MSLVPLLVGPVLVVLVGCTLACYDKDSTGPMGLLNRVLTVHSPAGLRRVFHLVPGGSRVYSCCVSSVDYAINKPNPIIQVFYLMLVLGGFTVFVWLGLGLVPNPRLSAIHLYLPFAWIGLVLYSFYVASTQSPGVITKQNVRALEREYEYDGFLFPRGKLCATCGTTKIARSKHCRMQNQCVAQFDHYCPWINNTVGALNFRYFVFFCLCTFSFLVYGTYVFANLLQHIVERDRLWEVEFTHSSNPGVRSKADWWVLAQYMLVAHGYMLFVLILCVVMGITLFFFSAYQLSMVYMGSTANEANKWGNVEDFYASDKWKRELAARTVEVEIDPASEQEPGLDQRMIKDFPRVQPRNIYDRGLVDNFRRMIWPPVHAFNSMEGEVGEDKPMEAEPTKTKKKKKN